jgi:hypothetical protein
VIKTGTQRWLGHLFRIQDLDTCRKLTVLKPEGNGRVGKPQLRRLESAEEDLKKMGVRKRRRQWLDREQWIAILEEAEVHYGLQCQGKKKGEIDTAFLALI